MNNKFKRFNKILMMTVAILLCFVLISTSVVSGIFAKYVITRSAGATVSLKAFGITLSVDGKTGTGITVTENTKLNSVSVDVKVTGISLAPGEKVDDIVKFTIAEESDGANVPKIKLKVKVAVSGVGDFNVPASTITGVATANYLPLMFTAECGASDAKSSTVITDAWAASDTAATTSICSGLKSNFTFTDTSGESNTVEKIILDKNATKNPITSISVKHLSFGMSSWASGGTFPSGIDATKADLIQTYLSAKTTAPAVTVIYTVSLEQVVTTT